jgi:hypothetical protein
MLQFCTSLLTIQVSTLTNGTLPFVAMSPVNTSYMNTVAENVNVLHAAIDT